VDRAKTRNQTGAPRRPPGVGLALGPVVGGTGTGLEAGPANWGVRCEARTSTTLPGVAGVWEESGKFILATTRKLWLACLAHLAVSAMA